jgi:hypothetical protein
MLVSDSPMSVNRGSGKIFQISLLKPKIQDCAMDSIAATFPGIHRLKTKPAKIAKVMTAENLGNHYFIPRLQRLRMKVNQ